MTGVPGSAEPQAGLCRDGDAAMMRLSAGGGEGHLGFTRARENSPCLQVRITIQS